jgi:anti-sigma-K factor RskA
MRGMSHSHVQNASDAHVQAVLEACAGLTLACAYSSSDEYEAEVIQVRRKAGAYRSRHHWQALVGFAIAAVAVVAVVLAISFAGD